MKITKLEEIQKKNEKKLNIVILNDETGFLNFLIFIAFTILITFKNFAIRHFAISFNSLTPHIITRCDICGVKSIKRNW